MNRTAPPLATAVAVVVATAATARIGAAQHAPAPPPMRAIVRPVGRPPPPTGAAIGSPAGACALVAIAAQGQIVAGAGALQTRAWGNPACLARTGAMAFVADIAGGRCASARGVFVADAAGVRAIAIGCGNGGAGAPGPGGDPAPGGGTLAGLFTGTAFAPAIDSDGDVVFLADLAGGPVTGGTVPRALFGYVAAQQTLVRIAAVGDAAPGGGTFTAVGPGVLADGAVAFAARTGAPGGGADLFWWRAGTVRRLAAVGDALPGGGTIAALATESMLFQDGTDVPIGPLPALDECGRAAFRAIGTNGSGGATMGCVVVRSDLLAGGPDSIWLRTGDAAPGGGTFAAFDAPILAGGSLAVFADVALGNGATTAGWFVGAPGTFRRALAFFDPVDGGQCLGLAVSRAPMQALDERGGLALWCDLALLGGQDRIVESLADGSLRVLARRGDPSPLGGVLGAFDAWPARSAAGRTVVSAAIHGGSAADAHLAAVACEALLAAPPCARVGGSAHVVDQGPPGGWFALAASPAATDLPLPPWGTLRIGPTPIFVLALAPYPGFAAPDVTWLSVPGDQALVGATFHFQSLALVVPDDRLTDRATTRLR